MQPVNIMSLQLCNICYSHSNNNNVYLGMGELELTPPSIHSSAMVSSTWASISTEDHTSKSTISVQEQCKAWHVVRSVCNSNSWSIENSWTWKLMYNLSIYIQGQLISNMYKLNSQSLSRWVPINDWSKIYLPDIATIIYTHWLYRKL